MAQTSERIKSSWLRDENAPPKKHDAAVIARVVMVAALTLTLVSAMRWAINITNTNARHISDNIVQIQSHISDPTTDVSPLNPKKSAAIPRPKPTTKIPGPSIDPVGSQAH